MPTATDLVTDLPADFEVFGQAVDTRLKALQPGTTLGDLAYSSATANTNTRLGIGTNGQVLGVSGGVPAWVTSADQTPLTTKGDVFTFTTVDARLGVGANGTVLTADSAEATGLKWAAPASGGMTLLSTTTLSGATTTISSISGSYVNLVAYVVADRPAAAAGFYVSHNGNSANYSNWGNQQGSNFGGTSESYLLNAFSATSTTDDNNFTQIVFPYYSATNNKKMAIMNRSFLVSASTRQNISSMGQYYNDTAALTSITFHYPGSSFSGGTVYLYGVK